MHDEIEKLIGEHRGALDDVETIDEDSMWDQVLNRQNSQPQSRVLSWKVTAAATILILVGLLFWTQMQLGTQRKMNKKLLVSNHFPSLKKEEMVYQREIFTKKETISFDQLSPDLYPNIFDELKENELDYEVMIGDLIKYPDEITALRVFIKYHERQLKILERLSKEIQKKNQHETKDELRSI